MQTVRETSAEFGNVRALPQAPRAQRFLTCHYKMSSRVLFVLHLLHSRLNGFAQNIRTVNEVSFISKTSRGEERGVILRRQDRKYNIDFRAVIVYSICQISQLIHFSVDVFTYNKYKLVFKIINNAMLSILL